MDDNKKITTLGDLEFVESINSMLYKHYRERGFEVGSHVSPLVLDKYSYCPFRYLNLWIKVPIGELGGRCWSDDQISQAEAKLADDILQEIRIRVEDYIKDADPFGDKRS